ncbi:MAG: type I glyceraldehyde-3-phosphate dehydrogenase [Candidatus Colwellbacteria bacterium CG10_big_fil_rev_8_21_14_0_10_42_22]|uniref:Type I glyceraldehyde-3-phosphate dehydrogenase n=1 Tax=Candidatus Colwellbacteria bacterium CG10_big_fil_rev_8_21_14_0_10_42_22 TaxID=1974540 RepID=A0A2H0VGL6_9BACT|nr:MAG: type I glyceraldehyde-3-phosphate dehydrogenase [Candidatus Colwellbacteria bacterium CG10_big_fil_rev_8_21_14_0_10_42_22]
MSKVAINGFGRIGRLFLRQALNNKNLEIVAINDLGDPENLAYLFKYDSVYGRYEDLVKFSSGKLVIGNKKIEVLQESDPAKLPWKKLGVDIVVEATGVFNSYEKAKPHLRAGAKRVVITAPSKDADGKEGATVLVGVNEKKLESVVLTSNGSCTTNATSPVISALSEKLGIEKAMLSTVHGYTASQGLVDTETKGKDFRKGRAAAQNIVPTSTGAAIAVGRAIPEMDGKFDGVAFRVPVIAVSLADITFISKKKTSVKEVNDLLKKAAGSPRWRNIMKVTDEQVVSTDIIGEPYGAVVDLAFTRVVDGSLVKVISWYDNEAGYVSTLVRHVENASSLV